MPTILWHIDSELSYRIDTDACQDIRTLQRKKAMIMRIIWGKLNPGTWDEYEQKYKETLVNFRIIWH